MGNIIIGIVVFMVVWGLFVWLGSSDPGSDAGHFFCFLFRDRNNDDVKSKKLFFQNGFEIVMTVYMIIATLIVIYVLLN